MYTIGNQARMRKLLGKPEPPDPSAGGLGATSSPVHAQSFRPGASQDAVFAAGLPIKCMDASPDGRSAVLAGPHIFKTVVLDDLEVRETLDLRALITVGAAGKTTSASALVAGGGSSASDQLSIRDVRWAPAQSSRGSTTLFTACAGGRVFQYDLLRAGSAAATGGGTGLDPVQAREDSRQVNTLHVNPHRGTLLLSGSQDGIARCFDIRVPVPAKVGGSSSSGGAAGLTFRSGHPFKCNDSVRQVRWSPRDAFAFACATDQGLVLRWDIRKHAAPLLKIKAHEKACCSLDWHPDGEHLVSAGADARCHVWDLSGGADKKQKPRHSLAVPAPVSVVAWRPGHWSAAAGARRAAQVAVSYDDSSQKRHGIGAVHVWDLARPTMPYKELPGSGSSDSLPSALLWRDQDLLWTAGQDGSFAQRDVAFAPRVLDRQTVSTMAFSSRGGVVALLDERAQPRRPRFHVPHQDLHVPHQDLLPHLAPLASTSSGPSTPLLSISRSDSEDELVGNFLGSRRRHGRPKRRLSARSPHALSTTPPSVPPPPPADDHPLSLDRAISMTGIYRSQQAMVVGRVPATTDADVYGYLSLNYLETLRHELPYTDGVSPPLPDRVASILEHYARAAENVRQFRLAQTWRVLAFATGLLLRRRAQHHLERRMRRLEKPKKSPKWRPLYNNSNNNSNHRSALSEIESTSNVPTPVAQPLRNGESPLHRRRPSPIPEPDPFSLPPAVRPPPPERQRLDSTPLSIASSRDSENSQTSQPITEGYDFYDTDALSHAIDVPQPGGGPTSVPPLLSTSPQSSRRRPVRHDSDDSSSQMLSVSGESRRSEWGEHREDQSSQPTRPGPSRSRRREAEHDFPAPGPLRQPLHRSETGLTSFTDEHHMITQTTSDSFNSRQDDFPSQTVESEGDGDYAYPPAARFLLDESPDIVEPDYLCWPDDPPYPHPIDDGPANGFSANPTTPLDPYALIARALDFEARSSALHASAIVLLLRPLLPDYVVDPLRAAAILRQHHARLMAMRLFVEAALLRKLCLRGWPGGLLADAAWSDAYPAIVAPAQQGVQAGLACSACHRPRENSLSVWRCDRCHALMAPCAVCGHRGAAPTAPPVDSSKDSDVDDPSPILTWWYCHGCGHGGHSSCLQTWHAASEPDDASGGGEEGTTGGDSPPELAYPSQFSDGCCPMDGCGHACLFGRWRLETAASRTEEVSRAVRDFTRAAAGVGGSSGGGGSNGGGGTAMIGSGSSSGKVFSGLGLAVGGSSGGGIISGISSSSNSGGTAVGGGARDSGAGGGASEYGFVRGDPAEAIPSRAVDGAREMLTSAGAAGVAREGILSSSPGTRGDRVERERRKSVKFVGQEERR